MIIEPFTITLPDGKTDYVAENKHLVDIAEQYVGCEFSKAIEQISESASWNKQYADKKFNSDMRAYEEELSTYNDVVSNIVHVVEEIEKHLDYADRLSRDKLRKYLTDIKSEIHIVW